MGFAISHRPVSTARPEMIFSSQRLEGEIIYNLENTEHNEYRNREFGP